MAITQELVAALDDLIQVGAQASASIRELVDRLSAPDQASLDVAMGTLNSVKTSVRTEQSMPTLITSARDAVSKLQDLAGRVGDSQLAGALKVKVEAFSSQMKASGMGFPWMTVLGVGAGAIAAYYLWKSYSKPKKIASFEYPDSDASDIRPKLQGISRALGRFRSAPQKKSSCRPRLGAADKYEFEPETRLEGIHRGSRRRSRK